MRLLCCCALALAGCGDPSDAFVGTYSVVGIANVLTVSGTPRTMVITPPSGTKLVITKSEPGGPIVLSLSGAEIARASCSAADKCETLLRADDVSDGDCRFMTSWHHGTVKLERDILELKRLGTVDATCTTTSSSFTSASGEQTLQATRD